MYEDAAGNVWIGTFGYGLFVRDSASGEISKPEWFDRRCTVNHIISDRAGDLWIATDIGLVNVSRSGRDVTLYDDADGMECGSVFSLVEDKAGNIWMSTNVGISCYVRGEDKFRNFGPREGVLPGPYIRHSCARKKDGTIMMGGMNGVCYFNETALEMNQEVPLPEFTSFTVLGSGYQPSDRSVAIADGHVTLTSEQNTFCVTFSLMNRSLADRSVYAYRMEGLSKDWIEIGHEPRLTFHNLTPGKYRLQLKAKLANQEWPESYSTLEVKVSSPPWLSPWAQVAYALIAASLVCAAILLRQHLAAMKRKHTELEAEVTKSKTVRQALIGTSLDEKDKEFVESLIKVVESRIEEEKPDVNEIARQLGLSYSSLYRRVKAVTGATVSDFIKRVRVHQAEKLLLTGRYSVAEIARMVGLSSVSYFRECFRKEFGMSPTQWIKHLQPEKG